MMPPMEPTWEELMYSSGFSRWSISASSSSNGSWLPMTTSVFSSFDLGLRSRTFTSAPASKPSSPWGTSRMPSAFIKEDTTPLPRLKGEAISLPPTQPMRTRTNSWYFRPETTGRVRVALAHWEGADGACSQWSIRGFSSCSMTMMPDTG